MGRDPSAESAPEAANVQCRGFMAARWRQLRTLVSWMSSAWSNSLGTHARAAKAGKRSRKDALLALAEEMLARAGLVSLVVFELRDLRELKRVFGADAAREVTAKVAAALGELAGHRGVSLRIGPSTYAVLLPGMDRERALAAIAGELGNPWCVELEVGGEDIVLAPEFAAEAVCPGATPVRTVYDSLCRQIVNARPQARQGHRPGARHQDRAAEANAARTANGPAPAGDMISQTMPLTFPATLPATVPAPIG
jgi:GGDEF domain-containing protein